MTPTRLLLIDDDDDHVATLCRGLVQLGITCTPARTAEEALDRLANDRIDFVLVDLSAPAKPGVSVLGEIRRRDLPLLVIAGLARPAVRGVRVLRRPFTPDQLGRAIEAALADHPSKEI